MSEDDEPVRTFRISMKNIPVVQVALDITSDPPKGVSAAAGVDFAAMSEDLLVRVLEGQRRAFEQHLDAPLGPDGKAPQVAVDLDRAEAVGLAHLLIGVRQGHEGPYDRLLLRTIAEYFVQIPDAWADSAGDPLPALIEAVKENANGG